MMTAQLLDMKIKEFQDLVDAGAVPPPTFIGGKHPRWNVSEMEKRLSGDTSGESFAW